MRRGERKRNYTLQSDILVPGSSVGKLLSGNNSLNITQQVEYHWSRQRGKLDVS
jgi:hypothetical protein